MHFLLSPKSPNLPSIDITTDLTEKFRAAGNKLLLLDYDGTLVNYTIHPGQALPSAKLLYLLQLLSQKPKTKLAIVTGRPLQSVNEFFHSQPFDIVAEHGSMLKKENRWTCLTECNTNWKSEVFNLMQSYSEKCLHSFIEEKLFTTAWHYRKCDEHQGFNFSRQLISELENISENHEFKITDGNKIVEVSGKQISKSNAVDHYLKSTLFDFILCIGDDKTDEDMFLALSDCENAYTIKVGTGETLAKYRLSSVSEVLFLLEQLTR